MSKEAYKLAARFFVDTVARVQPTQWDDVGLGEWNVRDLVGHTSRSLTRVEESLKHMVAAAKSMR